MYPLDALSGGVIKRKDSNRKIPHIVRICLPYIWIQGEKTGVQIKHEYFYTKLFLIIIIRKVFAF